MPSTCGECRWFDPVSRSMGRCLAPAEREGPFHKRHICAHWQPRQVAEED